MLRILVACGVKNVSNTQSVANLYENPAWCLKSFIFPHSYRATGYKITIQ